MPDLNDRLLNVLVPCLSCWLVVTVQLIPGALCAADHFVATDGDDGHSGSLASPWATVQQAMRRVEPGDTIYLTGTVGDAAGEAARVPGDLRGSRY